MVTKKDAQGAEARLRMMEQREHSRRMATEAANEYRRQREATTAKTERLRELRLAKEADDARAALEKSAAAAKAKLKPRPKKKAVAEQKPGRVAGTADVDVAADPEG